MSSEENEVEKAPISAPGTGDAGVIPTEAPKPQEVMGFLASTARNPWLCPNGHLMGLITRKRVAGGNISRLYVLRLAYHMNQVVPENMLFAIIDSGTVSCSICGQAREWRPGDDFLTRIQARRFRFDNNK